MKIMFLRLPIKIFWKTIAIIFITVNIGIYFSQFTFDNIAISTFTGYSLSSWEKLLLSVREFYLVGF